MAFGNANILCQRVQSIVDTQYFLQINPPVPSIYTALYIQMGTSTKEQNFHIYADSKL